MGKLSERVTRISAVVLLISMLCGISFLYGKSIGKKSNSDEVPITLVPNFPHYSVDEQIYRKMTVIAASNTKLYCMIIINNELLFFKVDK